MKPILRHVRRAAGLFTLFVAAGCLPDYERVAGPGPETLADEQCCSASPDSGCADTMVAECVCAIDSYCCTSEWDETCSEQIAAFGCGRCGDDGAQGGAAPEPVAECASDADCAPGAPLCADAICVQCMQDEQCTAELPHCGSEGFCDECLDDTECAALFGDEYPRCRVGLCVECATDAECETGLVCIEGTCG